jgi:peptidoglycan hydrolase CwlO-like protein
MAWTADDWSKIIASVASAMKELIIAAAAGATSIMTVWIQLDVRNRQDTVIQKQDAAVAVAHEVKKDLAASTKERDERLDNISAKIDAAPMNVAAPPPNPQ